MKLTFRQLNYAIAAARYGSLTAAADALHISQPSISTAITQIEETYGHLVDLIVDMGPQAINPTTVISLVGDAPEVLREGAGPIPRAGTRSVMSGPRLFPGR